MKLEPDRSVFVDESYLIGPAPGNVNFYGTWKRDGDLVRVRLRRRAVGPLMRRSSDEVIDKRVVGHLVFHEDGRVKGLEFPCPGPLNPGMSATLLRSRL